MKLLLNTIITLAGISCSTVAFTCSPQSTNIRVAATSLNEKENGNDIIQTTRREALINGVAAVAGIVLASPNNALAFDNKISDKYSDRPRQRGSKPKGLGVATRMDMTSEEYAGLKPCSAAPNCFCSTDSIEDSPDRKVRVSVVLSCDLSVYYEVRNIPPFKYPKEISSKEDAFKQLYEVVMAYEPGQNGIDGGGFEVKTNDPKTGYMYVQFESLKNGFIDDVEFAVVGDNKDSNAVQVRSSSRLGYLDYGVNAKRINFIAKALRAKGWDAPGVEFDTHSMYAEENALKSF